MSDYLSEDNLVLIWKYLPVKALLRFRCVCKGWKRHIDSPGFALQHLSAQKPRFFVEYGGRRHVAHPKHTCYGFWINPSSRELKILFIKRNHDRNCSLYSSMRGDWSVVRTAKLRNWNSCKGGPPLMIGGVAHWGGYSDELMNDCNWEHDHTDKVILAFDFVQECFEVIEMPDLTDYKTAPFRWQDTLSLVCWDIDFPRGCEVYTRQEDSWVKMFAFEVHQSIQQVFWVMEDMVERKKRGKRKREIEMEMEEEEEESFRDLIGKTQEDVRIHVRILSTIITELSTLTGELVFHGSKTGCKTLRKGLERFDRVNIAYDFVESLLFP